MMRRLASPKGAMPGALPLALRHRAMGLACPSLISIRLIRLSGRKRLLPRALAYWQQVPIW